MFLPQTMFYCGEPNCLYSSPKVTNVKRHHANPKKCPM